MKIILHIGTEKTGTTTLQAYLARNQEALAEMGHLYPLSARDFGPMHAPLVHIACDDDNLNELRNWRRLMDKESLHRERVQLEKNLLDEVAAANPDTLIFSAEHLSSKLSEDRELERLKVFLGQMSNDFQIVLYVRDQRKLLASSYSEAVKNGRTSGFKLVLPSDGQSITDAWRARRDATHNVFHMHDPLPFWVDYLALAHRWARVFGKENVTVRPFVRATFRDGDLIGDFFDVTGLPFDPSWPKPQDMNRSGTPFALLLLRGLNTFLPPTYPRSGRTPKLRVWFRGTRLLNAIPGKVFALDTATEAQVAAFFHDDNQRLAEEFMKGDWPGVL